MKEGKNYSHAEKKNQTRQVSYFIIVAINAKDSAATAIIL